ncbi:MAG: TonB-dependent receptor plug domain-containing protein [Bryobacteraceae bacterium]
MLSLPAQAQSLPARETAEKIEPVHTSITVTEKLTAEAPAAVSILPPDEIRRLPGVNLDDRLRLVPGFSLFRRSSSLVAHPTTQGVSLRGLGSTGASRTLVLWDGLPVNDPFGGWVYWTRFPIEELERVEISRGASTSVFGDRAMGGAIAMFSRDPERHRFDGSYEGGNRDTHSLSAGYSNLWGPVGLSATGRGFTTDGYFLVPERNRGAIDRMAGVRFASGGVKLDYLGSRDRFFLKSDVLVEDRENGTTIQRNSTSFGTLAGHWSRTTRKDNFSAVGYHVREEFHSSFSAIVATRATERLTSIQTVPAESTGGAATWRRAGGSWNALAGGDVVRLEGSSLETFFPGGLRVGGGSMVQGGVFVQGDAELGPARIYLGARHHSTGLGRRFFSPSAGLAAGRGRWRARGSVYRSFRAQTLNELFREFRAGTAVTLANDQLRPERLFGAEAGLDFSGESTRVGFSAFRNSLRDVITNVTLSITPTLTTRQRQNAAQALARGVEVDLRRRWRGWQGEASYLFVDSRFNAGFRTPQVARHQGSAQIVYAGEDTLASFGVRSYSLQYEDDRNLFVLPGFGSFHISLRQRLGKGFSATVAVENLLNKEYWVGFATIPSIGPPRLWRAGLRWEGRL